MFLFQLISVLIISIAFYTYLSNIVFFSCDLALRCCCVFLQLLFFIIMLARVHREAVRLLRQGTKYVRSVWNIIEVCSVFSVSVFSEIFFYNYDTSKLSKSTQPHLLWISISYLFNILSHHRYISLCLAWISCALNVFLKQDDSGLLTVRLTGSSSSNFSIVIISPPVNDSFWKDFCFAVVFSYFFFAA